LNAGKTNQFNQDQYQEYSKYLALSALNKAFSDSLYNTQGFLLYQQGHKTVSYWLVHTRWK